MDTPGEVHPIESPSGESTGGHPTSIPEPPPPPVYQSGLLVHAFAGLQASIVGIVCMFICFFVAAYLTGGGLWSVPNLFSTTFYGENAWQNGFFKTTWAGIALIVVLYGLIGMAWGCLWRGKCRAMLSVTGSLTGLAVYFVFFRYVWLHFNAAIPIYAPVRELQIAHVLWGMALSKSPGYSNRIARAVTPTPIHQEAAASVSGEVIQ